MTHDLTRLSQKPGAPSTSSRMPGTRRGVINIVLYFLVVPSAFNLALAIQEAPVVNLEYWFYAYAFGFFSWIWGLVLVPTLIGVDRSTRALTALQARWCIGGTAAFLNTAFAAEVFRTPLMTILMGASGLLYGLLFRVRPRDP